MKNGIKVIPKLGFVVMAFFQRS